MLLASKHTCKRVLLESVLPQPRILVHKLKSMDCFA